MRPASTALSWAGYWLEARVLLKLALPILIAQWAITGLGLVDTVMSGRVGTDDLAAIGLGSSLFFPVMMVPMGILLALTPLVSKRFGQDDPEKIKHYLQQGLWLALPLGALAMVGLFNLDWVLDRLSLTPNVYALTSDYLFYVAFGLPGLVLFFTLRFFWEGLSLTWPTMVISVGALAINVPLNALFIYGWGPVPAMGAAGCGVASSLVMWGMLLAGVMYLRRAPQARALLPGVLQAHLGRGQKRLERPYWQGGMRDIMALGVPNMLALLFEVSLFSLISVFIAQLGTQVIAANQVVMSYTSMAFMVPLSLSLAVSVRVGTALGQGSLTALRLSVRTGLVLALGISVVIAGVTGFARGPIAEYYTQDPAVIEIVVGLLLLAASYQVFDAIQVTTAGILRGLHNTQTTMWVTLLSYWVLGMGGGYIMAFTDAWMPPQGVAGFWQGILIGLMLAAILLQVKLRFLQKQLIKSGQVV